MIRVSPLIYRLFYIACLTLGGVLVLGFAITALFATFDYGLSANPTAWLALAVSAIAGAAVLLLALRRLRQRLRPPRDSPPAPHDSDQER